MSNQAVSTASNKPAATIRHRLIVPIQTRGNLGKSTEAIARCEWMNHHSIAWQGFDLDHHNRTLSTTFPDKVSFVPPTQEPESDIIRILRQITGAPVTLIDPSAHMNRTILKAFEMVRFAEVAKSVRARATVLIFPVDEVSDMDDIAATVDTLRDSVDWVVVRNPVKIPATRFFDGSELEAQLRTYNAASLTLPGLLTLTRNHLRAHEVQLGRGISPAEALHNPQLKIDPMHRMILDHWLREAFHAFDAISGHLLPDELAAAIQPQPASNSSPSRKRGEGINVQNAL